MLQEQVTENIYTILFCTLINRICMTGKQHHTNFRPLKNSLTHRSNTPANALVRRSRQTHPSDAPGPSDEPFTYTRSIHKTHSSHASVKRTHHTHRCSSDAPVIDAPVRRTCQTHPQTHQSDAHVRRTCQTRRSGRTRQTNSIGLCKSIYKRVYI